MSLNSRKLKEWVRKKAVTVSDLDSFSLWHIEGRDRRLVCRLPLEEGSPIDQADDLERMVVDEVDGHIDSLPGRQQYVVQAQDQEGDPLGEFAFGMSRETQSEAASLLALPTPEMEAVYSGQMSANFGNPAAQVVMQQMRHNELLTRSIVELSTARAERDAAIIAEQQRALDKAAAMQLDVIEMREEMLCRRHERHLMEARHEAQELRKKKLMSTLTNTVLPEIMRRVQGAGSGSLGNAKSTENAMGAAPQETEAPRQQTEAPPTVQSIAQIFYTLPPEMQNQLVASLSPEDRATLLSIFTGPDAPPPPGCDPSEAAE